MRRLAALLVLAAGCVLMPASSAAQHVVQHICPGTDIQAAAADFEPGGLIWTSFDRWDLWVYDIARSTRYPLPATAPCTGNCRLSPDAAWMTYFDGEENALGLMRLDGTVRRAAAERALDAEWWSAERLLVWTAQGAAYLQALNDPAAREPLALNAVFLVQPGGYWAVRLRQVADSFAYELVNLKEGGQRLALSAAAPLMNQAAWSPDGAWLAFTGEGPFDASVGAAGAEIFAVSPQRLEVEQWTHLAANYGAARINGRHPLGLRWSGDSRHLAFWVMEMHGASRSAELGAARIHVLEAASGAIRAYCGFETDAHSPNPPALVWSPDGTHLAFAGNVYGDDKGHLLLALNLADGVLTELSDGIYPNFGAPAVVAWGHAPG